MTSISLNTGLRALLSAQFMLDTVGHNISNANTPGYSRQAVQLGQSLPLSVRGLLLGTGVDAVSVQRKVDSLLDRRILNQTSVSGGLSTQLAAFSELESLFNEPGENGLATGLDDFFLGVSQLSGAPDDSILRTSAVRSALVLSEHFHSLASGVNELQTGLEDELEMRVLEVNELSREIADLNVRIIESESSGLPANDLRDQRGVALGELSDLVDTQVIEDPDGAARVLVSGNTLVSSARANAFTVQPTVGGALGLKVEGSTGFVPALGGRIGGLIEMSQQQTTGVTSGLDRLARNLIFEVNKIHSTGIPAGGAFQVLVSDNKIEDRDGDGKLTDELLSKAGLPFAISSGELYVNVTDEATGNLRKHRIDVSATHTTVGGLVDSLNAIDNLSASLDSFGRLRVVAEAGHRFDFSRRLDPNPDSLGTFGGTQASIGSALPGPFGLQDGESLTLTTDPGGTPSTFSIPFAAQDFVEISEATAAEIAAVINANPDAQANGIVASEVNGSLFLQTVSGGTNADFTLGAGPVTDALGWTALAGSTISGHTDGVSVEISGLYSGPADTYSFVPNMDGAIGTTPGLSIEVRNEEGQQIAILDVGEGYVPGTEIEVASGVRVSFGLGQVSSTHNDQFALQVTEDSDSGDLLVALGLNSFFVGSGAQDISVRQEIQSNPSLLASSTSGNPSDSSLLLDLLEVQDRDVQDLDGSSLGDFYRGIVGDIGFRAASTSNALEANEALINSLNQRRDQVSGVNVDEELVDLVQFEQAFSAAAEFISVVNQLNDELLSLI